MYKDVGSKLAPYQLRAPVLDSELERGAASLQLPKDIDGMLDTDLVTDIMDNMRGAVVKLPSGFAGPFNERGTH
eukprot:6013041-Lingulodinium_polyedra.AAC.1